MTTPDEEQPVVAACDDCGKTQKTKKRKNGELSTPISWKRIGDQFFCKQCWGSRYKLRKFTLSVDGCRVAKSGGDYGDDENMKELWKALYEQWRLIAEMSNYIVSVLWADDQAEFNFREEKLHKFQAPKNLYRRCVDRFPEIPSNTTSQLIQEVMGHYKAERWELFKRRKISLRTYRAPQPFVMPAAKYTLAAIDDKRYGLGVKIGEHRWELRLKRGRSFHRIAHHLQRCVDDPTLKSSLVILRRKSEKGPVLAQINMWVPVQVKAKEKHGTLHVRTDNQSLLVALNARDERLWIKNADHIRRWEMEHANQLQRWREDQKAEERPTASFQQRRTKAVEKHKHRIRTAIQQTAYELVNYAERRNFAMLEYDDSGEKFLESFPYFMLSDTIQSKCEERGIVFAKKEPPKENNEGGDKGSS